MNLKKLRKIAKAKYSVGNLTDEDVRLLMTPVPLTRADVDAAIQHAADEYERLKGTKVRPEWRAHEVATDGYWPHLTPEELVKESKR